MLLPVLLVAPLLLTGCGGGDEEIEVETTGPDAMEATITDITALTLAPGRTTLSGREVSLAGLEVVATAGENAFFVADASESIGGTAGGLTTDTAGQGDMPEPQPGPMTTDGQTGDGTTAPGGPLAANHDTRLLVVLDPSLSRQGQTTAPLTADTTTVAPDNLSTADTTGTAMATSASMPAEGEIVSVNGVVAVGSPEEVQENFGINMEEMGFDDDIVYIIANQVGRQTQ